MLNAAISSRQSERLFLLTVTTKGCLRQQLHTNYSIALEEEVEELAGIYVSCAGVFSMASISKEIAFWIFRSSQKTFHVKPYSKFKDPVNVNFVGLLSVAPHLLHIVQGDTFYADASWNDVGFHAAVHGRSASYHARLTWSSYLLPYGIHLMTKLNPVFVSAVEVGSYE